MYTNFTRPQNLLEEHRDALWAGIKTLADEPSREMLGSELRDVFDQHPPQVNQAKPLLSWFTC